jgi:hypothetical protein
MRQAPPSSRRRAVPGRALATGAHRGTGPMLSTLFLWMRLVHNRLGHPTSQLLP